MNKKLVAVGVAGAAMIGFGAVLLKKSKASVPETDIVLSNLFIEPKEVYPGESVFISVDAKNVGNVTYVATIEFKYGDKIASEIVTLEPKESKVVSIGIIPDDLGVVKIYVGSLMGVVTVLDPMPETASLQGVIRDAETGLPVGGAEVSILGWGGVADSEGLYHFTGIQPVDRTFEVAVVAAGYEIHRIQTDIAEGENYLDLEIKPLPPPPPTELVLTATNMPSSLWSGYLIDLTNGEKQSWGVQRIKQRVVLKPTSGNLVKLSYMTNYGDAIYGPFVIELPSPSGEFVWDATHETLDGAQAINLLATNNRQRIKGKLVSQDHTNGVAMLKVSDSLEVSGFENIGKYYIGEEIQIRVPIPLTGDLQYALGLGNLMESECVYKNQTFPIPGAQIPPYTITLPVFVGDYIRYARTYPDSAYSFTGSAYRDGQGRIVLSAQGAVSPFRIVLFKKVVYTVSDPRWGAFSAVAYSSPVYVQGPVHNMVVDEPSFASASPTYILAHPNPEASFGPSYAVQNWVNIATVQ